MHSDVSSMPVQQQAQLAKQSQGKTYQTCYMLLYHIMIMISQRRLTSLQSALSKNRKSSFFKLGLTRSLQEVDPDFLKTTSPHTRHSSSSSLAIDWQPEGWRDVTILWPHTQVYGPTENSCYFRWPPLLWTGQNLQVCSDAYRKKPASWQPKSLLITIERARRWFNSKISWLFFLSMASRIQKTTSSPNLQKYHQTDIFIWMCAFGHLTKPNSTSRTKQRKTSF